MRSATELPDGVLYRPKAVSNSARIADTKQSRLRAAGSSRSSTCSLSALISASDHLSVVADYEIPEPTTMVVMVCGGVMLLGWRIGRESCLKG